MKKKDPKIECLERKVQKAKAELDYVKTSKKLGLPVFETSREYTARVKREAKALPKETRQAVLDVYRRGGLSLEEMAKQCDVTIHQLVGVALINTKRVTYTLLNEKTV